MSNSNEVTNVTILDPMKSYLTDKVLQELAANTLNGYTPDNYPKIEPNHIMGIIEAENSRLGYNDNLPSMNAMPDAWTRALFGASFPTRSITSLDPVGISLFGFGAIGGAGVGASISVLVLSSNPIGLTLLGGAIGVALVSGVVGVVTVAVDVNTTVGRGQIGQAAWFRGVGEYGKAFTHYLEEVLKVLKLDEQIKQKISEHNLNDIAIKFNPNTENNKKIIENFMIAAVLLTKINKDQLAKGRPLNDAIKYAIAAYHGVDMNSINTTLEMHGSKEFPLKTHKEYNKLTDNQKDGLNYVYEVFEYQYNEAAD